MSELKLHIGGQEASPEWTIVDIEKRPEVDIVCDAATLTEISDASVSTIYASHVLEHFHYGLNDKLVNTLKVWHRVLQPGGELLISVPDLQTLCWLFLNPSADLHERHHIMRMMFGGHLNEYDVHYAGLDFEILNAYLQVSGFSQVEQVSEFNLFNDCSSLRMRGSLISLNVIATK